MAEEKRRILPENLSEERARYLAHVLDLKENAKGEYLTKWGAKTPKQLFNMVYCIMKG
jgi:hypothetical protein